MSPMGLILRIRPNHSKYHANSKAIVGVKSAIVAIRLQDMAISMALTSSYTRSRTGDIVGDGVLI